MHRRRPRGAARRRVYAQPHVSCSRVQGLGADRPTARRVEHHFAPRPARVHRREPTMEPGDCRSPPLAPARPLPFICVGAGGAFVARGVVRYDDAVTFILRSHRPSRSRAARAHKPSPKSRPTLGAAGVHTAPSLTATRATRVDRRTTKFRRRHRPRQPPSPPFKASPRFPCRPRTPC